jgi:UPF0176 protein
MLRVKSILNVAAYKFVALSQPAELRASIRSQAVAFDLKGTVLLAEEGINLMLSGAASSMYGFFDWLRGDARFADLQTNESESNTVPFGKLLVKVKREIVRMNQPTIRPQAQRAPAVDAKTLERWLHNGRDDEGRTVVTLDTRNGFEVDHGRFHGAIDWRLTRFSEFPQAALAHRDELRDKTVVAYCTGGIRCEKAALFMLEAGITNVLQLDGGILQYFEQTGGSHFDGECFVFDERECLDGGLAISPKV